MAHSGFFAGTVIAFFCTKMLPVICLSGIKVRTRLVFIYLSYISKKPVLTQFSCSLISNIFSGKDIYPLPHFKRVSTYIGESEYIHFSMYRLLIKPGFTNTFHLLSTLFSTKLCISLGGFYLRK